MDELDERGERPGTGLPESIELAWGVRTRRNKGPRPGLSLERILDAAIKVADADGLDAVSMSRVAGELGTSAMSLYRYVAAKDELLTLMGDAALGDAPRAVPGEGWRAGLSRWAWAELAGYQRHPWVARIPVSGPPITPNSVAWMEQGLRCMADTGLEEGEKLAVVLLLTSYTRSWALLSADLEAASVTGAAAAEVMVSYGKLLLRLTDPDRYPAIHALVNAGVFDEADEEENADFAFGLERLLDGVEVLVSARR